MKTSVAHYIIESSNYLWMSSWKLIEWQIFRHQKENVSMANLSVFSIEDKGGILTNLE